MKKKYFQKIVFVFKGRWLRFARCSCQMTRRFGTSDIHSLLAAATDRAGSTAKGLIYNMHKIIIFRPDISLFPLFRFAYF